MIGQHLMTDSTVSAPSLPAGRQLSVQHFEKRESEKN